MTNTLRLSSLVVGCFAVCLLVAGCGKEKGHKVSGKLTYQGKPLPIGDDMTDIVELSFYPIEDEDPSKLAADEQAIIPDPYEADVEKDGSFTVGRPLPAGKYKVAVRFYKGTAMGMEDEDDFFKGYYGLVNSSYTVEITGDTEELHLELDEKMRDKK